MNVERLSRYVDTAWDQSVVPTLSEYIRIPNKSVHFDPQWEQHGHMQRAAELLKAWCEQHALPGMKVEIVRLPGLTPLLYIDVPASGGGARTDDCVLLYGHMDKQPEFSGWKEGLDPWKPVLRDGRSDVSRDRARRASRASGASAGGNERAERRVRRFPW